MGLFNYFLASRRSSASVAKERLQILVAHERSDQYRSAYLPMLQREILEVIQKYVEVDREDVSVNVDRDGDCEILALSVVLPEPVSLSRTPPQAAVGNHAV